MLINQVLDLAKIESGKREINVAPVPLRQLAEHARMIFEPLAHEKGIRLVVEIADGVPEIVQTDGQRTEQILTNLLGNAIKFTARGEVALRITQAAATARFRRADLQRANAADASRSRTPVSASHPRIGSAIFACPEQVDGAIRTDATAGPGWGSASRASWRSSSAESWSGRARSRQRALSVCYLPVALAAAPDLSALHARTHIAQPSSADRGTGRSLALTEPDSAWALASRRRANRPTCLLVIEDDRGFAEAFTDVDAQARGSTVWSPPMARPAACELCPRAATRCGIVLDTSGSPITDGWRVMEELRFDPRDRPHSRGARFVSAVDGAGASRGWR